MILSAAIFIDSGLCWFPTVEAETPVETIPTAIVEVVDEEPESEIIDIMVEEPIIEETLVEEVPVEVDEPVVQEPSAPLTISETDIDLIALVTMAEAEGECEDGKRLVIDVILNRYESPRFPNSIEGVIYAKNAFECMWNGRVDRCQIRDDIRQLVVEELQSRTNSNIHYFRTNRYHGFGTPVVHVGNHYFSTY
jgi:N-acetylmuramoyl-L-alanine amidase